MKNIETKSGALEALEKIKEAEDQARKIIHEAKEEMSLKIIQEAQNEARTIKEKSIKEARAKAQKIRAELIKKAEEDAAQVRAETRRETEILRKKGSAAQAEAVKRVSGEMKKYLKGGII
jgi:vacuolar-type H+-ATPase subunit H